MLDLRKSLDGRGRAGGLRREVVRATVPLGVRYAGAGGFLHRATPALTYAGPANKWTITGGAGQGFLQGECDFYEYVNGGALDKNWDQLDLISIHDCFFARLPSFSSFASFYKVGPHTGAWYFRARAGLRLDGDLNVWQDWITYSGTGGGGGANFATGFSPLGGAGLELFLRKMFFDAGAALGARDLISGVCWRYEWSNLPDPAPLLTPVSVVNFWLGDSRCL